VGVAIMMKMAQTCMVREWNENGTRMKQRSERSEREVRSERSEEESSKREKLEWSSHLFVMDLKNFILILK
jgi:hypothetical protein